MVTKKKSVEAKTNFALISYILGIVAIVQAIIFQPLATIILGTIGLIFAKKEKSPLALKAKKLNIIALIVGIIIFLAIILITYLIQMPMLAGI